MIHEITAVIWNTLHTQNPRGVVNRERTHFEENLAVILLLVDSEPVLLTFGASREKPFHEAKRRNDARPILALRCG